MQHQQPYDNSMKSLFKDETESLIECLLPGVSLLNVLDIEVLRPPMRADRVYRVKCNDPKCAGTRYSSKPFNLHLEFQAGADDDLAYRVLVYHANLLREHKIPVHSIILYLFRTSTVKSPLLEIGWSGEAELTFNFEVQKLWEFDACKFMRERKIEMYAMLPAMENANGHMLLQAIDEMVEYYQENKAKLTEHLFWFNLFFQRADLLPLQEKQLVEERLNTFQQLIEEDALVRKQRELGREEGRQALRETLLTLIEMRFPSLLPWAQQKISSVQELDTLKRATQEMLAAPDEARAGYILGRMQK